MASYPMSHVSMLRQTSDNSWTLARGGMNTPISTIESCDHLPNPSLLAQMPQQWHILAIFHLKFGVWCIYEVFIIEGFTLKSEGANIYYVGDGHCSFLGVFAFNKNKYHP
jgi:hypothetical protein